MENIATTHYKKGEAIITEGDYSNGVFFIISGAVKVTKKTPNSEVVLATQGKNTIFGEMNLIDGKTRSASVIATEDTYCYQLDPVAMLREFECLDANLIEVLKALVAIIRYHNYEATTGQNDIPTATDQILKQEKFKISYEHITGDEVNKKINALKPPFIRSLFRILMSIAFKEGEK